ncbi:hypothetical protein M422DRAFT_776178 [Sphaerobolus stellatus SS14]|nr:hypothetical protein M422DRAFT_776178 [Sphaerobolus stellatus SS14]
MSNTMDGTTEVSLKRTRDEMEGNDESVTKIIPWLEGYHGWMECINVTEALNLEISLFGEYMRATEVERCVRRMTIETIRRTIKRSCPDSQVLVFGSYTTDLYLPDGDINVTIESAKLGKEMSQGRNSRINVLNRIGGALKRGGITNDFCAIHSAKVPIIKFKSTLASISIDISINQTDGMKTTEGANHLLAHVPAIRPLVIFLEALLNRANLNDASTHGLNSYSLLCLVVSFLQQHPRIKDCEIDPSLNLGVLVMEFFELYGRGFSFETVAISILNGGQYFLKPGLSAEIPMQIVDPMDPNNCISRAFNKTEELRCSLMDAYHTMMVSAYMRAGDATDEGRRKSILESVIWVDKEFLKKCAYFHELFHSGQLQKRLNLPLSKAVGPSVHDTLPSNERELEV